MRALLAVALLGLVSGATSAVATAQGVADLFGKVATTVVVVRAETADGVVGEVGSGVVVSSDGRIMTAAHVIQDAGAIKVQFLGGKTVAARVLASEQAADLALLQLDPVPPDLKAATLANSDTVRVGEQVVVVGAPYGLGHALSVGWISARWAPGTVYRAIPLA